MSRIYEGSVDIELHHSKGIMLTRGDDYNANEAAELLAAMMSFATEHKEGIDRWSLYCPDIADGMSKEVKQLTVAQIAAAMEVRPLTATLIAGKYGKPQLVLAGPTTSTKKKASIKLERKSPAKPEKPVGKLGRK